uniref:BHLH domain-containing protein n=1 Tax=Panagrolaimus sp. ES5 TaxID=591445 RepID=A0AC34FRA7_9BILA
MFHNIPPPPLSFQISSIECPSSNQTSPNFLSCPSSICFTPESFTFLDLDDNDSTTTTPPPTHLPPPPPQRELTLEEIRKIAKAEKRKRRRATLKYRTLHASRERIRVESFNKAFGELRALLPTTPNDKKLSKIEILRVSIAYIRYLNDLLLLK